MRKPLAAARGPEALQWDQSVNEDLRAGLPALGHPCQHEWGQVRPGQVSSPRETTKDCSKGNVEVTHFQAVNPFFMDTLMLLPNFLIRILQFIARLWSLGIKAKWFPERGPGSRQHIGTRAPPDTTGNSPRGSSGPQLGRDHPVRPCLGLGSPPRLTTHVVCPPPYSVLWAGSQTNHKKNWARPPQSWLPLASRSQTCSLADSPGPLLVARAI